MQVRRFVSVTAPVRRTPVTAAPAAAPARVQPVWRSGSFDSSLWASLMAVLGRLGQFRNLVPMPSPPPRPAPVAPPVAPPAADSWASQVLAATNRARASHGLAPLKLSPEVSRVAERRSADMIQRGYFAHTDPDGHDPFWHMARAGVKYRTAGENIAYGQPSPEAVVDAWLKSPGHRANILNPAFTGLGVGVVKNAQGTPYWTQLFVG